MMDAARQLESRQRPWLRAADQVCIAGLVLTALGLLAATGYHQYCLRGRWVDVDRVAGRGAEFQLAMNDAGWPEWSVLPGIGEGLAKRIVESRRKDGPFRSPEDLLRVRGVGPRTLERIRAYLR